MGIIAWIVLGLVAGLLANMVIPGRRTQGLIVTCLIGVAGALGGGWLGLDRFVLPMARERLRHLRLVTGPAASPQPAAEPVR